MAPKWYPHEEMVLFTLVRTAHMNFKAVLQSNTGLSISRWRAAIRLTPRGHHMFLSPCSCDGKTECDIKSNITYDPGVCKYLETTYDCFTHHSVTCGGSQSKLQCGENTVIVVSWANYGRRDKTTCPDGRPDSQLQNVYCSWSSSMEYFAKICTVEAPSSVDPCHGTYEYLEVFFTCQGKLLKQ
uniref:SUEL-type lectin domain-containing protein n=1 Tax=Neolamprologus brichardi TaxID=32507 RepID=A0A3Q4H1Y9_NEOBR